MRRSRTPRHRAAPRRVGGGLPSIVALAAALATSTGHLPAAAQSTAIVAVADATIGDGVTGAVAVSLRDVRALYGADVQLAFDPTVLEVQDGNPGRAGIQVGLGSFLAPDMVVRDTADNAAGTVHVAFTQISPSEERSGSGVLFTVVFKALRAGATTEVRVTSATLSDRNGMAIPNEALAGRVTTVGRERAPATPTNARVVEPTLVLPPPAAGAAPGATTSAAEQPPAGGAESAPNGPPSAAGAPMPDTAARPPGPTSAAGDSEAGAGGSSAGGELVASADADADEAGDVGAVDAIDVSPTGVGDAPAEQSGVVGAPGVGAAAGKGGASAAVDDGAAASERDGARDAQGIPWPWLALVAVLLATGLAVLARRT